MASPSEAELEAGSLVRVHGLSGAVALNGALCRVVDGPQLDNGRIPVVVLAPAAARAAFPNGVRVRREHMTPEPTFEAAAPQGATSDAWAAADPAHPSSWTFAQRRSACQTSAEALFYGLDTDQFPAESVERIFGCVMGTHVGQLVYSAWQTLYRSELVCRETVTDALMAGCLPQFFKQRCQQLAATPELPYSRSLYVDELLRTDFRGIDWDHRILRAFGPPAR